MQEEKVQEAKKRQKFSKFNRNNGDFDRGWFDHEAKTKIEIYDEEWNKKALDVGTRSTASKVVDQSTSDNQAPPPTFPSLSDIRWFTHFVIAYLLCSFLRLMTTWKLARRRRRFFSLWFSSVPYEFSFWIYSCFERHRNIWTYINILAEIYMIDYESNG